MTKEVGRRIKELEKLLKEYDRNKEKLKAHEEILLEPCNISGVSYDKMPTGTTKNTTSPTEKQALSKIDTEERIRNLREEIQKVDKGLRMIFDDEKYIIKRYYIDDQPWDVVKNEVGLCQTSCSARKRNALKTMVYEIYGVK